ncbi:MAG: energy-coupling factor transporter transmembrane protein EcfT [Oscillospiraceae bacterium]|nr:energy-coupling factor transporter transmembrane protein EcfT [Oscillospiraceae bacterium]
MLKDVTLGQFFPGNSFLHKADPRIKLVVLVVYLVFVLLAKTAAALGIVLCIALTLALISRIRFSVLLRSLRPVIFILLFTGILNLFLTTGETPLVEWKFLHIYPEGIRMAVFMMLRLVCLVEGSSLLLSYTTSPLELTDAIESLFGPLKRLHVPVHEFAMMMTIALRFIPTLMEETDKIISAQKARGADFESGGLIKKAKALIPILIPLFVSAFRRADELAEAMECRCYHGGEGRTKLKVIRSRPSDYVFLLLMLLVCGAILPANWYLSFTVGAFTL